MDAKVRFLLTCVQVMKDSEEHSYSSQRHHEEGFFFLSFF